MAETKTIKPKIEDEIAEFLDGDAKKTALAFTVYLRENKLPISRYSHDTWKASYKGKGLCRIMWLKTGSLFIIPYADYTKDFNEFITMANLQEIIWNNLHKCRRCNPRACAPQAKTSAELFKGFTRNYFGKEIDGTCKFWNAVFCNPDIKAIDCIKKMIEYKKQTIINNEWRKHNEVNISKSLEK